MSSTSTVGSRGSPALTARLSRLDPNLALVAAWSLISLGAARRYGTYTPLAIALVTAGMVVLSVAVLRLRPAGNRAPGRLSLLLACLVALVSTVVSPAERYARGPAEWWSHGLLIAAAVALTLLALWRAGSRWLQPVVLLLAGAAGVAGIRATPRPTIDDWHILQGSARAVLRLSNSYGQVWPGSDGHLLPYLPGSAVLLAPFYLVFSDVRYGLLAALLLASVAVAGLGRAVAGPRRAAADHTVAVLSGLVVVYPWVLYGIEQSWPEALLLGLLAGMVWAVAKDRPVLAAVCFTAALLTKQHVLIFVPFAALWPAFGWRRTAGSVTAAVLITLCWVIAGPRNFWHGAVSYNLRLQPRHDSLSLFATAIDHGWTPSFALVPLAMIAALALGLWWVPRTGPGFVLGSAWLLGVFNLLNKQSFFNEWSLVVGLIVLGLASLALAAAPAAEPEPAGLAAELPGEREPSG
ncbi:MAG: hypothetical protein ACR2N4_13580 [Jatrophihabitans sp.]